MDDTIKYYATEYMNGEKRYDYAMINFVSDEGVTLFLRIMGLWGKIQTNAFAPYLKKNGVIISVIGSIDSTPQLISYLFNIKYRLTAPSFL